MKEVKENLVSFYKRVATILRENGYEAEADKMDERAEMQAKKSSSGGESKTAVQNKALAETVYTAMEVGVDYTATAISKLGIEGIETSSKATAVLKVLIAEGKVTNTKVKGTSFYRVA